MRVRRSSLRCRKNKNTASVIAGGKERVPSLSSAKEVRFGRSLPILFAVVNQPKLRRLPLCKDIVTHTARNGLDRVL